MKLVPLSSALGQAAEALGSRAAGWWVIERITGRSKAAILRGMRSIRAESAAGGLTHAEAAYLTPPQTRRLQGWLREHTEHHKPLQYLLGDVPFCGATVRVRPPVFIPRPETEQWAEWVTHHLAPVRDRPLRAADLCTGSGCLAKTLGRGLPAWHVDAVEIDAAAVRLARENTADELNVAVRRGHLFAPLQTESERYDLVVSNPPYLGRESMETLPKSVALWESPLALDGCSPSGLAVIEEIVAGAERHLCPGGALVFEIEGATQRAGLEDIFAGSAALDLHTIHRDLAGHDRWVVATVDGDASPVGELLRGARGG